ncbi:uncharacterized protein [Ranitomeya imitator]|uniref:uncharacterized protein n=1 Tax=Ranitomeya imitator TaxID=111125 RepID=UPI0037E8B330
MSLVRAGITFLAYLWTYSDLNCDELAGRYLLRPIPPLSEQLSGTGVSTPKVAYVFNNFIFCTKFEPFQGVLLVGVNTYVPIPTGLQDLCLLSALITSWSRGHMAETSNTGIHWQQAEMLVVREVCGDRCGDLFRRGRGGSGLLIHHGSSPVMSAERHTDPLVTEAYQLAQDYIAYVTGRANGPAPSVATRTLRQAGDELLERFPIFFKRWPRVFQGVTEAGACDFLIETIDDNIQGYRDRQTRHPGYPADIPWGTDLSIYVLAGQMAVYCQEHGMESVLEPMAERVGAYVGEHVCPVLRRKGGWVGFIEHFRKQEDLEKKMLSVCCTILAICSALLLTYVLWRKKMSCF